MKDKFNFCCSIGNWQQNKGVLYRCEDFKTFEDFCLYVRDYPPGTVKHGEYLIRCVTTQDYRCNANCYRIKMLVIDGDCSSKHPEQNRAPRHATVSGFMDKTGLAYCLCSSFSNGEKQKGMKRKRKWRLFVPVSRKNSKGDPERMKATMNKNTLLLLKMLQDAGVDVAQNPESSILSQAWFLTRSAPLVPGKDFFCNPTGKFWKLAKPETVKIALCDVSGVSRIGQSVPGEKLPVNICILRLERMDFGLHEAIVGFCVHRAGLQRPKDEIRKEFYSLLACKRKKINPRWKERVGQIDSNHEFEDALKFATARRWYNPIKRKTVRKEK
jgi:hypothetical protein